MKFSIAMCFMYLITLSLAKPQEHEHFNLVCPPGTHVYDVDCAQKIPEPTCDEPNPVKEDAVICDFAACYCDSPAVRDTRSKKCVALDQCPKKD